MGRVLFAGSARLGVLLAGGLVVAGCANTVTVEIPPRIDLTSYSTIGIIEFDPASDEVVADLGPYATQRFISVVQSHQAGVRFLELGDVGEVLDEVGREQLGLEALRLIGERYRVDTVFAGEYAVSRMQPEVNISSDLSQVSASAKVKVSLTVKHRDTDTGATIWSKSRHGRWSLASMRSSETGGLSLNASVSEDQFHDYMDELVHAVTRDFRVTYEEREVEGE